MANGFYNPDLKQIYDALQDGNTYSVLSEILNALLPTNNLVSFTTFTGDVFTSGDPGSPGILENYEAWRAANPDYVILNECTGLDATTGKTYLLVRYRGLNLMASDAG